VLNSFSVETWKLLSQSETASIQLDMKDHDSRESNWHAGLRGEEQREEKSKRHKRKKAKILGVLLKLLIAGVGAVRSFVLP
jgi:hypothetical protein